ncbi:MAG TPA: AraC family transcriptional regulator [Lachnospiraceae bacterium]|nr:AraC family transcriptional regulator [Lachnospiraceae bacterium]
MAWYAAYGEIQKQLTGYYKRTGNRMQFPEIIDYMYNKGLLLEERPNTRRELSLFGDMSDEEFDNRLDRVLIEVTPRMAVNKEVLEDEIIPLRRDVFVIRHPRDTRPYEHAHNYVEMNFIVRGEAEFFFNGESRTMTEGEFCIIAPGSRHDLLISGTSLGFCIMIRKSTFDTTFFSLLTGANLLSDFFRQIIQNGGGDNFLLFHLKNPDWAKTAVRCALAECYAKDDYSNACTISWINLLFAELLRNYSNTVTFYDYTMGSDFALVLQYIQHNYKTITLSSLADFFHYSEPHLCTLIRQKTGQNFTDLIKKIRLQKAVEYLAGTNMKIAEIADLVGYNSADHFSRIFRSEYHVSPAAYRKTAGKAEESFIPFQMEEGSEQK